MKSTVLVAVTLLAALVFADVMVFGGQKKEGNKPLAAYSSIAVSKFEIDKGPATEGFPDGLETIIQSRAVKELRRKKVFLQVADGTGTEEQSGQSDANQQVILSANVVTYDKGNRATRYLVGFGAGESRLKMRFVLRDAGSGAEVLHFDQQGTFKGTWSAFGGGENEALFTAAGHVVDNLIKELQNNR